MACPFVTAEPLMVLDEWLAATLLDWDIDLGVDPKSAAPDAHLLVFDAMPPQPLLRGPPPPARAHRLLSSPFLSQCLVFAVENLDERAKPTAKRERALELVLTGTCPDMGMCPELAAPPFLLRSSSSASSMSQWALSPSTPELGLFALFALFTIPPPPRLAPAAPLAAAPGSTPGSAPGSLLAKVSTRNGRNPFYTARRRSSVRVSPTATPAAALPQKRRKQSLYETDGETAENEFPNE